MVILMAGELKLKLLMFQLKFAYWFGVGIGCIDAEYRAMHGAMNESMMVIKEQRAEFYFSSFSKWYEVALATSTLANLRPQPLNSSYITVN